jgi:hypothetical protein
VRCYLQRTCERLYLLAPGLILTTLAYGAEVLLTGLLTVEPEGKRFAVFLACISVLLPR